MVTHPKSTPASIARSTIRSAAGCELHLVRDSDRVAPRGRRRHGPRGGFGVSAVGQMGAEPVPAWKRVLTWSK